jgi:hypothetical protein
MQKADFSNTNISRIKENVFVLVSARAFFLLVLYLSWKGSKEKKGPINPFFSQNIFNVFIFDEKLLQARS